MVTPNRWVVASMNCVSFLVQAIASTSVRTVTLSSSFFVVVTKVASVAIFNGRKCIGRSIKQMIKYRTLDDVTIEYFTQHPEEIDAFLTEVFSDYARDGDSATLLSALRIIARVKGVSAMAAEIGMTRQGLQKALSANGNPRLDTINAIMRAMGYQLMPRRMA